MSVAIGTHFDILSLFIVNQTIPTIGNVHASSKSKSERIVSDLGVQIYEQSIL